MNTLTKTLVGAAVATAALKVPAVRKRVFTGPVMQAMDKLGFLPTISQTERTAIEAGSVWVDGELFSGKPDFHRINREPYPQLTEAEQAFLDGPVEELCTMVDDWKVHQERGFSDEVWDFMKEQRFFGMIIPEEYGGLGFGPLANSAVVQKLSTCSVPLSITVMVPNSLGPAELLLHYGTEAQKQRYLPSLANGKDVPAFALTEPGAGSDAGALQSRGEVFEGDDGKLYVRLTWRKRYITLAAISTVLGLAFKLHDPDNLLGKGEDLGITCALVPTDTDGVKLGRRHDPLGVPFYNCPTEGDDVVVPLEEAVIGGREGAGRGWQMLMESLAAGRGISLPAQSTGGVRFSARVASGHASVRKQFGLNIGKFEGIEEPLARLGGFSYMLDAARTYTIGALTQGISPAVVAAILKYQSTELQRQAVNDGMDILGGNAISEGPRNMLAHAYKALPIAITVEGANILTRTLMIFGQGAIRCHPYAFKEITALENKDLDAFDAAFTGHIGHVFGNLGRSLAYSISRGALAPSPVGGVAAPYYKKLAWASATFAFMADLAMGTLGGELKRKEKITGRYADVLIWMYLATAALRRFEAEGRPKEDEPFLQWSVEYALARIQEAFDGIYENIQVPGLTWFFRGPVAAWSRLNPLSDEPSDRLGQKVAQALQAPGSQRDKLTLEGIYFPDRPETATGKLEEAYRLAAEAEDVVRKVKGAIKARRLPKMPPALLVDEALATGVLTEREADLLRRAETAREEYIQVDSFPLDVYKRRGLGSEPTPPLTEEAQEARQKKSAPSGDGARALKSEPKVKPAKERGKK